MQRLSSHVNHIELLFYGISLLENQYSTFRISKFPSKMPAVNNNLSAVPLIILPIHFSVFR